jgi:hypothetical protein
MWKILQFHTTFQAWLLYIKKNLHFINAEVHISNEVQCTSEPVNRLQHFKSHLKVYI